MSMQYIPSQNSIYLNFVLIMGLADNVCKSKISGKTLRMWSSMLKVLKGFLCTPECNLFKTFTLVMYETQNVKLYILETNYL